MILNEWFQFIYFLKKKSQFIFSISIVFNFQKSYLHLLYQKNLLQNFNLIIKNYFYLLLQKKWMNFYNFIYKNISICFHLRKSDLYKFKKKNFIFKRIFN